MLRTDVYVKADLCHAKWPDKPRKIWHYKMHMLLFIFWLVHEYTLFVCIWSRQLKLLEEMKLDTDVLEETFAL